MTVIATARYQIMQTMNDLYEITIYASGFRFTAATLADATRVAETWAEND